MKNNLKRFTAVLACTALTAALALPARAAEDQPIRVGSYKGTTLEVGERSGLVIGPGGSACTVTSSDPDTVEVEQVMNFWTAVAKAEGSAEITVSNQTGETATLTLTVGSHAPQAPTVESGPDQGEALDVRLELVRLVNEVRRENGVAELPVSEALMSAAQTISDKKYTWHHTKEECEAALACGYPYGFGVNLTVFTGVSTEDTAQHALDNWLNSPGHFETMIKPDCDSIGVGVTESGSVTYCYLFVGRPNTHNPYEELRTEHGHGEVFQPQAGGPFLMPKNGKEFFTDEEKPFSHPYDGPAARAGVYAGPAAHRGVGGGRPQLYQAGGLHPQWRPL